MSGPNDPAGADPDLDGDYVRVRVAGLGPIGEAEVEIAPLTVLIGRNGAGKSYLASVIWAILAGAPLFDAGGASPSPGWIRETAYEEGAAEKTVTVSLEQAQAWLDGLLASDGQSILRSIFASDDVRAGEFSVILPRTFNRLSSLIKKGDRPGSATWGWHTRDGQPFMDATISSDENFSADWGPARDILFHFMNPVPQIFGDVPYIPAARTGLVLAYPLLVERLFEGLRGGSRPPVDLFTTPVLRFLQSLATPYRGGKAGRDGPAAEVADFVETQILQGSLRREEGASAGLTFKPAHSDVELPMHLTSSLVTEVAPIVEVLRSPNAPRAIVLEEPEAHLHLSAQRCMARAIARLVNAGVRVVVTTHSDTFLQQLNLLLSSSIHGNDRYPGEERLSPRQVRAYEMTPGPRGAKAEPLTIGEFGLVVPSLNEIIADLSLEAASPE